MPAVTDWLTRSNALAALEARARERLAGLKAIELPAGKVLFRPGDEVSGFVLVVSGRVGVYMTGPTGREILLYSITPGETCVQTTLGLLGVEDYSAEAVAETALEIVVIPKPLFMDLLDTSTAFRTFVFHAFASRLQSIMQLLERLAFTKIEERLAAILLERCDETGRVRNTHQDLATAIGSAREVVSRRLELFGRKGLVALERGHIEITSKSGLMRLIG
ncbi:cAMP-activated global transcriptional regulator CRP [bacterium BMS3Bbin10]|nr:cAMP-activated global transcriptional regulator CRP [bacterium BMS3Bbin10]